MRTAISLARKWTLLVVLAAPLLRSATVAAQMQIPQAALPTAVSLEELLEKGRVLEQERRWSDALAHYEEALRTHPDWREVQQRESVVRAHLDISRRYADASFVESLNQLSEQQALDLYAEVLLKIDTYHVHEVNWGQLVYRGILNLQVAPTEPAFVSRFPQPTAVNPSDQFLRDVNLATNLREIRTRHQARDSVATVARIAARDLLVLPQAAVLEFTCAAVQSLDQYSAYLTGDQLDEVFSQIEGNFVGLGIELKADQDTLLIVNVIPGGPADEAGIVADERIIEVDGMTMREVSTDAAADMLKGEELTFVTIVLQSPQGRIRQLRVQRRRVDVPSVQDTALVDPEQGVGYLKLTSFQKTTSRDVDNALWSLHRLGMRALIIDLRGNPGGLLNAAVEVADKFLTGGTIVSTRGRSAREDYDYQAHSVGTWRVPLVVMIDGDSASASEIFAGAIRDHQRGTVVGQRSYGKGSVQGIFPLSRYKSGVRLTTAKFYSPSGQAISDRGVSPDVVVSAETRHVVARPLDDGRVPGQVADPALQAAISAARQATQYQVRRAP